jgi:glutamate carboxypeptidase
MPAIHRAMLPRPILRTVDAHRLHELSKDRFAPFVETLQEMVNVDCGSYTPAGVNRIADMCELRLQRHGWTVERTAHTPADGEPQLGDLIVGRLEGSAGPRVLMIGHMDTVFDEGTALERPFRIDGTRAFGPGVSDMKGGLLMGFEAVELLQRAGFDRFERIVYVCNPDEEIGSPFSGPVIRELAGDADVALVLEGARANGDVVSARKGITDYRIEFRGRAAHAGVEPEKGRSAVLQAAHTAIALHGLNGRWPGVTINVGVVHGGTRTNVVPDHAVLEVDLRSPKEESMQAAAAAIRDACERTVVPDVEVEVHEHGWHRPMEKREGGARLAALAAEVAGELEFELHDAATGGASDANNTSAAGVPTLDGLGPVGGDDHAPGEWIDLESVVPRVALLAGLISRMDTVVGRDARSAGSEARA